MPTLHIPEANPIYFNKKVNEDTYAQKYSPNDYTNLQVVSVGGRMHPVLTVADNDYKVFKTITPPEPVELAGGYFFYTFSIEFFDWLGCYRLYITDAESETVFVSGLVEVATEHEALAALRYKNTKNKDDINYSQIEIFALRVEGGFLPKNYVPHSDDTVYQDQTVNFEMLHSDTYKTRMFTAGYDTGIPDWLHYIIHKAWGCDTVFVNNDGYVKYTEAEWTAEEVEAYDYRTWTLEVVETGELYERDVDVVTTYEWENYTCRVQGGMYTGYAAALDLTIIKRSLGGAVVSRRSYSILNGFVYNDVVYNQLTTQQYESLSLAELNRRATAFVNYVVGIEGPLEGITNTSLFPVNLVSGNYNLVSGNYNLTSSIRILNGVIIDASGVCVNTGTLYAGGWNQRRAPQTETEVKSIATVPPVTTPSPFILANPGKGDSFNMSAPIGTLNVSITLHAELGKPSEIYDNNQGYDIADQFELSATQVTVDGFTCNVYSYTGLVPFAGPMELSVKI